MSAQTFDKERHNVFIYDRQRISISGVWDVTSFDENEIVLTVSGGSILAVEGSELNISVLDLERGCVEGQGNVFGFYYSDRTQQVKSSILSKIFRGK